MLNNNSAELREWASRCEQMATSATDENERAGLLKKCEALRALADSEDWLAGVASAAPVALGHYPTLPLGGQAQAPE